MKHSRHKIILDIIAKEDICSQEGLMEALNARGISVTQATVSRDIKTLDLIKVQGADGKYKYSHHTDYAKKAKAIKFKAVFIEAVISVDYAINTVVIKCHVGMANAACAALDAMEMHDVVGTLAGDDTIFVLLKTEESAKEYMKKIKAILE